MRRKSILFLLIVAGICNALIAQNLVTKYEYYDYYQSQLKEKYTMLVDGTRHGKSYHYREEGPLWKVEDWNNGYITTETTYYLDGKTIKTHTTYVQDSVYYNDKSSYYRNIVSYYVSYNRNGDITEYYSIKHTPGKLFSYYTNFRLHDDDTLKMEYIITSVYDETWKYTLSSDGNTADIKNIKTGAHFTYNYKKQELKINNLETIFFEKSTKSGYPDEDLAKQKIKNNIVTYEVLQDVAFIHDNGYVYQLPKGLTGQYTIKNIPLSNTKFHSYFFRNGIFSLFSLLFDPMATKNKVNEYGREEEPRQEGLRIPLPDEVLKQGKVVGIIVKDNNNTKTNRLLRLINGDYQNGMFECAHFKWTDENKELKNRLQITTQNGEIVKYKEYNNEDDELLEWNIEATKINTSYDENNKSFTLDILEGTLSETNWKFFKSDTRAIVYKDNTSYDVANKDTLTKTNLDKARRRGNDIEVVYVDKTKVGKFETNVGAEIGYKFIEGEITYNYYDYDVDYENSKIIISKKISKKVSETGKFKKDLLIEGKRVIIDKNGKETTYEGKFHKGKFIQGEMKSNGVSMVGSFENGVFVNGTKTLTFNDGNTYILKGNFTENGWLKNGQIDCSGNLSFHIWKLFGNTYFEFKKMTCTLPSCEVYIEKKNGDVFEGIIPKDILCEFLRGYITAQENPNTTVKGKYTKSDGNILEGTFKNINILNKDLNVRMHISGTANFATKFGHYIGGYANGKAIGAGKMIVNDLGEFAGYFAEDKLSKDSICIVNLKFSNGDTFKGYMLGGKISGYGELRFANGDYYIGEFVEGKFSGTGNVRYTHKKGVYEGKVDNFVCQYDTPQDKKALKKVKSPKVPKIQIPSKVGKMSVTTPE